MLILSIQIDAARRWLRNGLVKTSESPSSGEARRTAMILDALAYEADGSRLIGELAFKKDLEPGRPGIVVFPEGNGLGPHAKLRAQRLAAMGYVALAADLYGDGLPARDLQEGLSWVRKLTDEPARLRARAAAARDRLARCPQVDPSRIAAIGFCFGGTVALELARSGATLAATVCFHGILSTADPGNAINIRGKVLACLGADDPLVPPDQRAAFEHEMTEAGVDWQVNLYGGAKHSFTNPDADTAGWPALAYHPAADERSWQAMRIVLREAFKEEKQ